MTTINRMKYESRRAFAWRVMTSRISRRAAVLLAGLCATANLNAQSPYQQSMVAVPNQNAAVPTFTFQRAGAPAQQLVQPPNSAMQRVDAVPVQVMTTVNAVPQMGNGPTFSFQRNGGMAQSTPVNAVNMQMNSPQAGPMLPVVQQQLPPAVLQPTNDPALMAEPVGPVLMVPASQVVVPVVMQQPSTSDPVAPPNTLDSGGSKVELKDFGIEVHLPNANRLFRFESDSELKQRIATEFKERPAHGIDAADAKFPTYSPLTDETYQARSFAGVIKQIEPNYVLYGRLYAEELNSERYGWSLGAIQPIVSTATAVKDMAMLPYNWAARPCQRYETSAGRCYPGDPIPYLIYHNELSTTGAAWETGVIIGAFVLIP